MHHSHVKREIRFDGKLIDFVPSCSLVPDTKVPLELVIMRRSPKFDINGTGFLDPVDEKAPWPENMVLFGTPSEDIDDNWERLIGDRYFSVTEEEATRAWGDKRHEYVDEEEGGYTAG